MPQIERVKRRLVRKMTPARFVELGAGGFEGYASLFGVRDGAGDIVARGAFAASLRRRGPEGVRMLYQHFAHEPIGVWDEIREDARGLYVRGHLVLDVERARDVLALLREGGLGGLSIGFKTVRARKEPDGARTLLQLDLWEVSIVTFPLLESATVTGIGSSGNDLAAKIRTMTLALKSRTSRISESAS